MSLAQRQPLAEGCRKRRISRYRSANPLVQRRLVSPQQPASPQANSSPRKYEIVARCGSISQAYIKFLSKFGFWKIAVLSGALSFRRNRFSHTYADNLYKSRAPDRLSLATGKRRRSRPIDSDAGARHSPVATHSPRRTPSKHTRHQRHISTSYTHAQELTSSTPGGAARALLSPPL